MGTNQYRTYFSVEEYKRPKFEIIANPIRKSFRINDDITFTATAKTLVGFPVNNAKVQYSITQRTYFQYWQWRNGSYPNSRMREIVHGTTVTDSLGIFRVIFRAIPDLTVKKTNRPIFIYEVKADVTDLNGETRSLTKSIKVGYEALKLNLDIRDNFDIGDSTICDIESLNYSDDSISTSGVMTLYKLRNTNKIFRTEFNT